MKKLVLVMILFYTVNIVTAQNVGIGTNAPNASLNILGNNLSGTG